MGVERGVLGTGLMLGALGAVLFSGKAIVVKLSYRYGVDAIAVIMYRMLFALPLFAVLAWWTSRGAERLTARDWRSVFSIGFTGYYLASFLDFAGLQYVGASLERLILYLNPTLVLLFSVMFYGYRVQRSQWLALGLSYVGVVVVFAHELSISGDHVVWGALLVFASAVSYASYLVFSGAAVKRIGALRLSGLATSVACILCIGQFFVLRDPSDMLVAPEVIWLGVLNGVAFTFIPVICVMIAIDKIGASLAAQIGMVGPIATVAFAVWLLDEPFTIWAAGGTLLVLSGVWQLSKTK